MADTDESRDVRTQFLAPPVLAAIRSDEVKARVQMERTASQDIREERADLKVAAEQSPVVVVDIGLDGTVRWVSPSWKDVVGTTVESIQGKPIANILAEGSPPDTFANAVHAMKEDDSKSVTVRFKAWLGPLSVLRQDPRALAIQGEAEGFRQDEIAEEDEDQILNLEGQGIMVYDRSSGGESHVSAVL
jgi:serine/threonine-protein kinase RIM15